MDTLRFDGQTVVIINGGYRLGRAHALFFASRGANVVVNQYGGGSDDRRGISVVNNVRKVALMLAPGSKPLHCYTKVHNFDLTSIGRRQCGRRDNEEQWKGGVEL